MLWRTKSSKTAPTCRDGRHSVNDAFELERTYPAILVLSSTYGSSRGDGGICRIRDTFQVPEARCSDFEAAGRRFVGVAGHVTGP